MFVALDAANFVVPAVTLEAGLLLTVENEVSTALALRYVPP
jgi:hypothetical protein